MQTLDHDQVTVHIDAPPDVVYALVADVTRTPEFSPEVQRCAWLGGATGPAVGARFAAVNKGRRGPTWANRPVVTAASPGREFAFSRTERFAGTLVWRYQFEPDGTGTQLTESYHSLDPSPASAGSSSPTCTAAATDAPTCAPACNRRCSASARPPNATSNPT
jgi:hypothetical protein